MGRSGAPPFGPLHRTVIKLNNRILVRYRLHLATDVVLTGDMAM
jgi:hypothetical protein